MASDAKQYAARNRQGSDWFSHSSSASSDAKVSNPEAQSETVVAPAAKCNESAATNDRTQMIKPSSNSNNWYKYDHEDSKEVTTKPHEEAPAPAVVAVQEESKASEPKLEAEAINNQQRSKAGMASDWFSHEHADGTALDSSRQHGNSKELGANAARMRGESENWFSHDHAGENVSGASNARNRSTKQPANDSMRDIFHHGN